MMRKTYLLCFFVILGLGDSFCGFAAEWQWSVPIKSITSGETNDHPTAFLWVPSNCRQIRGVVIGQHNMLEEGILEHQAFRKTLSKLGFAEIWITPATDMVFNFKAGAGEVFNEMMDSLAVQSGYQELKFAPVIPIGHSAAASYPWNFAAWNPGRTLAILSVHGDAPLTNHTGSGRPNPDWGASNINGIPGLFVMGEYEWGDQRIVPAMNYVKANPKASIAYLCDAGHGHFDFSDELVDFLCMFLSKASKERLPKAVPLDKPVVLKAVDPAKGWLVDRWRKDEALKAPSAPYGIYSGTKDEAGWAFDKEMATATEKYYAAARGKIRRGIAYAQDGNVLPASGFEGYKLKFNPLSDGLTFHVSALLRDTSEKSSSVKISRICGPVIKVNDTTFKVSFYRMGLENKKRTNDIWLMATEPGDEKYKSSVQQANLKIPFRNTEGKDQKINFPAIPAQKAGIRSIKLQAVSDVPVPVSYYIKDGPAEIDGDVLVFTQIPPRAKFPVKVTVVAWQYGQSQVPKLKTAKAVERTFYINKTR